MDSFAVRGSLVQAFRLRRGSAEELAHRAVQVLGETWPTSIEAMARDELLAEVLQAFPVFPAWLERQMTDLRRRLLFASADDGIAGLLSKLAIQCHLNEYAWFEDSVETLLVDRFVESLADLTPHQVMALACYRPLARLPGVDALLDRTWLGPVQDVLKEQIVAVREEQEIGLALASLTAVRAGVSEAVRSQYEENPYPRWRFVSQAAVVDQVHGRPFPKNPEVLVVGCGTGRHAIEATLAIAGCRTLAVDLSRASLAYAVRKTRELGIDCIEYAHADLLELAGSGLQFDIVQSAGVLHHMEDPFEAARKLCQLVKPGGLVALGLYSAKAREVLKPAKELATLYTPQSVRALRRAILDAPEGDPVKAPATMSRDFYATSGCRDLIMHVQEHELRLADIQRIVTENNLTFLGFHQFEGVKDTYLAMFPHDPQGLDLEAWDAFEAAHPSTFGRMFQFWAQAAA